MQQCLTSNAKPVPSYCLEDTPAKQPIMSRFGEIFIDPTRGIHFPNGLFGMPNRRLFYLTTITGKEDVLFKILHSLEEPMLSFLVLPLALDNTIIEKSDIVDTCGQLSIPLNELTLLTIVTTHPSKEDRIGHNLSLNCRAPLFIDSQKRIGNQVILPSSRYAIQHPLTY